ncbi:MAG: S8 family peptidase [Verrucomicrobiota bacterium]
MTRPTVGAPDPAAASPKPADGKGSKRPSLRWDPATDRYEAAIPGWPIHRVLARLGGQTGWRIWIEDGIEARVQTRFSNLPAREALPRILGGLNYSLTTSKDGRRELKVFATRARSSTREILGDAGEGPISDELIIRSRSGAAIDVARLAGLKGATLLGTNGVAGAYRVKFDSERHAEEARQSLAADSDDLAGENNQRLEAPEAPVAVSGPGVPPLRLTATVRPDGHRRVIALIDSAPQTLSPEFQAFLLPTVDVVPGSPAPGTPSHGTSMAEAMVRGLGAGTTETGAAGPGTSTRIQPYNVYGAHESASTWDVARGISQAAQDGATIINLSLGSAQDSPYLRDVIQQVTDQGALVIAAAGNNGSTEAFYPAAYESTLAVTAIGRSGQLTPYANRGGFVDLAAPGATVVQLGGQSWMVQGTSVSAAYTSGLAGALGQNPQAPLGPVRSKLIETFPIQAVRKP